METDTSAIETELGRILKSRCFRSRKTLQKFLDYIVRQTLAGNADQLTQCRIAVDGLGKAANFNATYNPLVRIQAGRLRRQLEEYYTTEGCFDPLRVSLPQGSYYPVFSTHEHQAAAPSVPECAPSTLSQSPDVACILVQLAPNNAYSHLYCALACLLEGNPERCLEELTKAQALSPLDTHLNVLAGMLQMGLGNWETGRQLIQHSANSSTVCPDWWHSLISSAKGNARSSA